MSRKVVASLAILLAIVLAGAAHAKTEAQCRAESEQRNPAGTLSRDSRAAMINACVNGGKSSAAATAKKETYDQCIQRQAAKGQNAHIGARACRTGGR